MSRKKFMAINTYNSQETKNAMWSGVSELKRTDLEWEQGWTFENANAWQLGSGLTTFFLSLGGR